MKNIFAIIFCLLFSCILILNCAGTKIPALSENMIISTNNIFNEHVDKSLKVNKLRKCELKGSKWNFPTYYLANYQDIIATPFDSSIVYSLQNLNFFSDVVPNGETDYELNIELILDYFLDIDSDGNIRRTGLQSKAGLIFNISYELKEISTGHVYNDTIETRYLPSEKDGKKEEWLARSAEYSTKENLNKYLLLKSTSSYFTKNDQERLNAFKQFVKLYISDPSYNYTDVKSICTSIIQDHKKNNVLIFNNQKENLFNYVTSFSYIPTIRNNIIREFHLRNSNITVQSCFELTELFNQNEIEYAIISNNLIEYIKSVLDADWKDFKGGINSSKGRLSPYILYTSPLMVMPGLQKDIEYVGAYGFNNIIEMSLISDYMMLNLTKLLYQDNLSNEAIMKILNGMNEWKSPIKFSEDRKNYYGKLLSDKRYDYSDFSKNLINQILKTYDNSCDLLVALEYLEKKSNDVEIKKISRSIRTKNMN